ncbi:hypothetical protein SDC9_87833 [bioreactor metagenome]|uniref:Proteinase inhibitor I42 chagasin domain-containing protein n=1 Tax=bioreactor metagenome TaxID=1076179 RepID=A0A644ZRB2_9ZZZZ
MKIKLLVLFTLLCILISACGPGQTFGPTYTPTFTLTATSTITPLPTITPTSTSTLTPTPMPTNCAVEKIRFVYPVNGQTIDYVGSWLFMVRPISCSQNYLWSFYQNDTLIFQQESNNEFGVAPYSKDWNKFAAGYIKVSVQYKQNDGTLSNPTTISLFLQN